MRRVVIGATGTAMVVMLGLGARGVAAQCCGDCSGDGTVTVNEIITAVNRALTGCQDDGVCSMASCPAQLATCQTDLADCLAQPGGQRLPASGQTTSYGPGSDGDVRTGAALAYTDNGDGTATDNNTGLMWEKKDDSGSIHDKDNGYTWGTGSSMNGTMVTTFLSTLNTPPCFAGHCDWRIPNVKELQSIVDYEIAYPGPTVSAAFHNAAGCNRCTDVTQASCSCTASNYYWSSTTGRDDPVHAWGVGFYNGGLGLETKTGNGAVRAVRGGL